MKFTILSAFIILISCNSAKMNKQINAIQFFKQVITGNFDNSKQIAIEKANNNQIHPYAKHINDIADPKIKNWEPDGKGFFVLEESYYETPSKPIEVKPYLFYFYEIDDKTIGLKVYNLPKDLDKKEIKNSKTNLFFDFKTLELSPTFKGAVYNFDSNKKIFTTLSENDLGNGMVFTLTETLSLKKLIVMELLVKNGKQLTPYNTPIIYDRL